MRAIWKGAVSFGLVSVPVKLYAATESHDVSFRQVHASDGGRIRYQRVCSVDGEEVPYSEIAKGFETEDGEMVVLDDGPRRTYSTWYGPAELRKKTMSPSRAFAYEVCVNMGERRIH